MVFNDPEGRGAIINALMSLGRDCPSDFRLINCVNCDNTVADDCEECWLEALCKDYVDYDKEVNKPKKEFMKDNQGNLL